MHTRASMLFAFLSALAVGPTASSAPRRPPTSRVPITRRTVAVPGSAQVTAPCEAVPPQPRYGRGEIEELVSYGRYFVHNRYAYPVQITADGYPLRTAILPPGSITHIADVMEGTGGHVRPSNFFSAFSIRPVRGGAPVYSGVRNEDWKDAGPACPRARYLLVIGP